MGLWGYLESYVQHGRLKAEFLPAFAGICDVKQAHGAVPGRHGQILVRVGRELQRGYHIGGYLLQLRFYLLFLLHGAVFCEFSRFYCEVNKPLKLKNEVVNIGVCFRV